MTAYIPDSLIFDLDGTLWDAVQTYSDAWNLFFGRKELEQRTSKKELDGLMGLEEGRFLEIMLPSFSPSDRSRHYKEIVEIQYDLIDSQGGFIYEGVIDGLERLTKRYPLFIVSNCPEHTIRHFQRYARVDDLITDSLSHGQNYRPKNENIRELMHKHDLQNPLYIGDTDGDRIQSEMAGVPFVFVEYGFGNSSKYLLCFKSFSDLSDHFVKLSK